MERILNTYRAEALPIIHVVRLYNGDGSNVDLCRQEAVEKRLRIVMPQHTEGAELVYAIRPMQYDSLNSERLLDGEFQAIGDQKMGGV